METLYLREIKHIIANFYIRNKSTAYRFEPKSNKIKIICDMIKLNWIEHKMSDGQFLLVRPSEKLKLAILNISPDVKAPRIPVLKMNLKWNHTAQNSQILKAPGTVAA